MGCVPTCFSFTATLVVVLPSVAENDLALGSLSGTEDLKRSPRAVYIDNFEDSGSFIVDRAEEFYNALYKGFLTTEPFRFFNSVV